MYMTSVRDRSGLRGFRLGTFGDFGAVPDGTGDLPLSDLSGQWTSGLTQAQAAQISTQFAAADAQVQSLRSKIAGTTGKYSPQILDQLDTQSYQWDGLRQLVTELVKSGTVGGVAATGDQIVGIVQAIQNQLNTWASLSRLAGDLGGAQSLSDIASSFGAIFVNLAKTLVDLGNTGVKTVSYLPWIIGALVLGPPIIAVVIGAMDGGKRGALGAAKSALESGRSRVGRAFSR